MYKLIAALALAPLAFAQDAKPRTDVPRNDPDYQRAVQFQRAKDRADAVQARKERRHPSVNYTNADRSVETDTSTVKDPGPRQVKKDQ